MKTKILAALLAGADIENEIGRTPASKAARILVFIAAVTPYKNK